VLLGGAENWQHSQGSNFLKRICKPRVLSTVLYTQQLQLTHTMDTHAVDVCHQGQGFAPGTHDSSTPAEESHKVATLEVDHGSPLDTLAKFSAFTTNIWGADKVYKVMMYSARLLGMGLEHAQDMPTFQEADVRVQLAAFALQSMSSKVSDNISTARYILRFFGTVDWAVRFVRNPYSLSSQPLEAALHQASAACMLLFHPADHTVWLGKAAPDLVPNRTVLQLQRFGTRAANVFLLCQLLLKLLQLRAASRARAHIMQALQRLQSDELPVPRTAFYDSSPSAGSPSPEKRFAPLPRSVDSSLDSGCLSAQGTPPPSHGTTQPPPNPSTLQARQQALLGLHAQLAAVDTQISDATASLVRYALDWLVTLHFALPRGIGLPPVVSIAMSLLSTCIAARQQWLAMG